MVGKFEPKKILSPRSEFENVISNMFTISCVVKWCDASTTRFKYIGFICKRVIERKVTWRLDIILFMFLMTRCGPFHFAVRVTTIVLMAGSYYRGFVCQHAFAFTYGIIWYTVLFYGTVLTNVARAIGVNICMPWVFIFKNVYTAHCGVKLL